ncbi:MAG: hypothetical protein HYZ42_00750 [Bacteroidetes bacterium]|nr:hypothetical protein [Bacteroidota bacterium]
MKINKYTKIVALSIVLIAASCQSHEQKSDESFELFKEEKLKAQNEVDSVVKLVVVNKPGKVEYVVKKGENIDAWTGFKSSIELRIVENENRIKTLKKVQNLNSKVYKKILSIEKTNYDLRKKLNEYIAEEKVNRENFKLDISNNINLIDTSIKMLDIGK